MKGFNVFVIIFLTIAILTGCTRKFTVTPEMQDHEFTVQANYGNAIYYPIVDSRDEFDKEGKVEGGCSGGTAGITHLGDENYENPLLLEFDNHLRSSLQNSHLFLSVVDEETSLETTCSFTSSLDKYHVTLDEAKAQQTQACIGGIIGAAIAASIDVTAITEIQLTGKLTSNNEELWQHTITKKVSEINDYSSTRLNTENSMGKAIGEACKALVTELAVFLASE